MPRNPHPGGWNPPGPRVPVLVHPTAYGERVIRNANTPVQATPLVRRLATDLGVNLSAVAGTGAGGRIRAGDVRAARSQAAPAAPRPAAPPSAPPRSSRFSGPELTVAAARRQPGRDAQAIAADIARASARRPAPTLFTSGDTPPFTASGIDPESVLQVPWAARHALAAARTPAAAYDILAGFEGLDDDSATAWAEVAGYSAHPGNVEYADRVQGWLSISSGSAQ